MLRSCTGGCQGSGGSTIFCVAGAYHEALCDVQRACPTTDIAATADDSYLGDEIDAAALAAAAAAAPPGRAPALAPLYHTYEVKRDIAEETCCLHSNISKAALTSPCGDLSLAPACLPGSPAHPTASAPLRTISVAGIPLGDGVCGEPPSPHHQPS